LRPTLIVIAASAVVVVTVGVVIARAWTGEPKTTTYYFEHPAEMKKMLDECRDRAISPFANDREARDCRAAAEAQSRHFFQWKK